MNALVEFVLGIVAAITCLGIIAVVKEERAEARECNNRIAQYEKLLQSEREAFSVRWDKLEEAA